MENNVLVSEGREAQDAVQISTTQSQSSPNSPSTRDVHKSNSPVEDEDASCDPPLPPQLLPSSALKKIKELIDKHHLTRQQLIKIYDDHVESRLQLSEATSQGSLHSAVDDESLEVVICEPSEDVRATGVIYRDTPPPLTSLVDLNSTEKDQLSEIGQKRKQFTLEEELKAQDSPFVECLLERDQGVVAQVIKRYMSQYSIPQREVVELTGLNQSHLSQHFLHGVTMKRAKRVKLYQWFEEDQKQRTGKVQSTDGNLSAVLESPRVDGKRRPRWKWSPISTQILTEAFKKNQFPTRDQRMDLARICNEAEVAMNNGAQVRGPEGDTEGITEQRVNTWFTNRRKGLGTPITPPAKVSNVTPGTPGSYSSMLHPTLLRASPATTPVLARSSTPSYKTISPQRVGLLGTSPSEKVVTPTTLQSLVSQIQESQVVHHKACPPAIPSLLSHPSMALPLAIALPPPPHTSLLASPSTNHNSTPSTTSQRAIPLQAVTVPMGLSPSLVSPSQVQTLISQFHSPLTNTTATTSGLHDKKTRSPDQPSHPLTVQSVTIASDPNILTQESSPSIRDREGVVGGMIISPAQLQALVQQIQTQQKPRDNIQIVTLPFAGSQ